MIKRFTHLLYCALLLSGCSQHIIDDLALIDTVTYDLSENEEKPLTVAVNYPIVTKEGDFDNEVLSVDAKSSKDARLQFKNMTNLELVSGQLTVALFGEEFAKTGISDILDTFMRDPSLGPRVYFAISEGRAIDFINLKPKQGPNPPKYLRTIFERAAYTKEVTNYNSLQFIRDYFDDGIDPIMPYIILKDGKINLDGYALFDRDQFIEKISPEQASILFFLRKDIPRGTISMEVGREKESNFPKQLLFNYHQKKFDLDIKMSSTNPISVDITIELEGSVLEYTGETLLDAEKAQKKFEKKINRYLTGKSLETFQHFQELGVDPLGIGAHVRNKLSYKEWKEMNWDEVYPTITLNVHPKMKFMNIGQAK
ncbi:Ger(x)C family spore germination protein [Cytobacillus spongiae]|jgi:spore germination protein|uniref:Ger(x)C family spore germination protein n=1 Tax=Cytobacillus spongiae TaxID=2901381 RepID=UPI001F452AB0|nr:Ger(x)C family spore germination protein [Cytobacillus spongiae]UII57096.1 Ger(x)C family spore germination protein [Cytobacillus spongiae]